MSGTDRSRQQSRFPKSLFFVYFISMLLMSGIHTGANVLTQQLDMPDFWAVNIPILYWAALAAVLTLFTRWRIVKTYDEPTQELASGMKQVANGDFSVYIPPASGLDKVDYFTDMIHDFNTMVEELGSIETLKTDFFSNVSHEIKTPIAVIQNHAELLKKGHCTKEQEQEYLDTILHATHKLSGLITNMLKLGKLEKQVIRPVSKVYDVSAQLCECALQFEAQWEKKDIEFEAEVDDQAFVLADEELLELVWTNLLSNAIKFTPNGGTVSIGQTTKDNRIVISVKDTGCGMDKKTVRHIFEKFYQGDTSHATEGNGLGLALVQRILELTDGTIQVQSVPGQGTEFTVTLPAAARQENRE